MKNQIYYKRDGERYIDFFTIERETKSYLFLRKLTTLKDKINIAIDVVTPGEPTDEIVKHYKKYALTTYEPSTTIYTNSGYQGGSKEDDRLWLEFRKRLKREENLKNLLVD